jgi:hypothetical protein
MPSSFVDSFAPIVKLLVDWQPRAIIDIGPGWGKYGLACREYLSQVDRLDAIEVPQGLLPTQSTIYDFVYVGDVRAVPDDMFQPYDIALIVDVIEHMPHADGHELLNKVLGSRCKALVSTPKVFTEQHDDTNPFESHVSLWTWEDFAVHGIKVDASTIDSIIYLLKER